MYREAEMSPNLIYIVSMKMTHKNTFKMRWKILKYALERWYYYSKAEIFRIFWINVRHYRDFIQKYFNKITKSYNRHYLKLKKEKIPFIIKKIENAAK